jgi:uncharacterized RDD family membrane protein YckC
MSREILIDTPENVALEYELAGLGTRFQANLVDTLLQLMVYGGVFFVMLLLYLALEWIAAVHHLVLLTRVLHAVEQFAMAAALIAAFVVFWGYYIYFEYRWNGQTPGKRGVGLRVIREGGYPVDLLSVILRNLLRIIDFFPAFYFAGIFSILLSKRYQRVGDLLSGTIVVKNRAPANLINLLQATRLQPENLDREALALMQREADRLSHDEYRAVRHFTERRRSLPLAAQQQAARVLAEPLMQRLHIVPPPGVSVSYVDVLEYLAVAYENARRPRDSRAPEPVTVTVAQPDAVANIPLSF